MNHILDVGCGSTPWGSINVDINCGQSEHHSFDYDIKQISNFSFADAQELPFKNNSFDIVVVNHCIEHLPHPLKAIQGFKRVAKHLVLIKVPNHKFAWYEHPYHLYSWGPSSLKALLETEFPEVHVQIDTPNKALQQNLVTKHILSLGLFKRPLQRMLSRLIGIQLTAICYVEKRR